MSTQNSGFSSVAALAIFAVLIVSGLGAGIYKASTAMEPAEQSARSEMLASLPDTVVFREAEPVPAKATQQEEGPPEPALAPEPEPEPAPEPEPEPIKECSECADLSLSTLSSYGGQLNEGESLSFSVVMQSSDAAFVEDEFAIVLYLDRGNDGTHDIAFARKLTERIPKETEASFAWRNAWIAEGGEHRLEACVDVDNAILESNERNNCVSLTLSIDAPAARADLRIVEVGIVPSTPQNGDLVSVSAVIRNTGEGKAKSSDTEVFIDGGFIRREYTPPIDVGAEEDIDGGRWRAAAGKPVLRVCADGREQIAELDEANNCMEKAFSVSE